MVIQLTEKYKGPFEVGDCVLVKENKCKATIFAFDDTPDDEYPIGLVFTERQYADGVLDDAAKDAWGSYEIFVTAAGYDGKFYKWFSESEIVNLTQSNNKTYTLHGLVIQLEKELK